VVALPVVASKAVAVSVPHSVLWSVWLTVKPSAKVSP
jgi:hypothetical protein